MDWGKLEDQQRMVFKIPIKPRRKWWQFWKTDDNKNAKKYLAELMSAYKDLTISIDRSDRVKKIEPIRKKISANYHSLYE